MWQKLVAVAVLLALTTAIGAVLLRGGADGPPEVVRNSLVKIDPSSNAVVDVIPVGSAPGEVAIVGDYIFVVNTDDQTLSRLDTLSGEVTTAGAVGAFRSLARDGDRFLWVTSLRSADVLRIDVDSLLPIDRVRIPRDLSHAYVAVGGGSLWVSQFAPSAVSRFRLRTLELQRSYEFPFTLVPFEVVFAEGAAWVALGGSNELLRIDARDGRTSRVSVGTFPSDPVFGFGSLWAAMAEAETVWRVDPTAERVEETVKVGRSPWGHAIGAGSVWVSNQCDGTVSRIDPRTDEISATIETGLFPQYLAFGKGHLWVALAGQSVGFSGCD